MRRAKIVATIGPSSSSPEMLESLIRAGMDVARLNMSHGTHEAHLQVISNIRKASQIAGREISILCDLQGPKIRVDKLTQPLKLENGQEWVIGPSHVFDQYPQYHHCFIPTIYKNLVKDSHVGAIILFDDGLMQARAIEKIGEVLKIVIEVGGELKSNKGINLPNVNVSAPSLTEKDEEDLLFGLKNGVDYVALSFVRSKEDILKVKYLCHQLKVNIPIISKIEKPEAIANIDEIIAVTDCIMIARGDMAVEVGNHLVPAIQKEIITKCNHKGVPVITATQMLESMTHNPTPTRAEANDVANAIWDGTDAVMLSGETAGGKYPLEAIKMMSLIVTEAEKRPKERPYLRHMKLENVSATLQVAASIVAEKNDARFVLCVTESGNSALHMSRFRPNIRVIAATHNRSVMRKLSLYWGVESYYFDGASAEFNELDNLQDKIINDMKKKNFLSNGDRIVITHGDGKVFKHGTSNTIRVEIIKDVPRQLGEHTSQDVITEASIEKGKILLDTTLCASCQNCISICPHQIWTTSSSKETTIDLNRAHECTKDMECVRVCPTGAIEIIQYDS